MRHDTPNSIERQVTSGDYGHFINPVQAFSPDDQWVAYDNRNADPDIGKTSRIERVHLTTGQIENLYTTSDQSIYGPGVGAVAYSPVKEKVIFIHGIENSDINRPYGITRRTGVGVDLANPGHLIHYDARDIYAPYTIGALRGGSHAHSWSGDGNWISFTYNDEVIARLSLKDSTVEDLRMVAVMAPGGMIVVPKDDQGENNDGSMFSMVVTLVTEEPRAGSDEISKAYEDGWIGRDGYTDSNGIHHRKAIAFLGDVRNHQNELVTEVFVVDLPDTLPDLIHETQLKGDEMNRPQPLSMIHQRRVTFTTNRKYPGVQGPRQWMKSSPDGNLLYFMMKDDKSIVQLYSVPTVGGGIRQITTNDFSIDTAFDIDPSGEWAAFGAEEKIYITSLQSGKVKCLTPFISTTFLDLRAIQWSHSGHLLAYNRKVAQGDTAYFQIFTLSINGNE